MRGLDEQIASLRQRIAQQEGALKQTKRASREQTLQIREKAIQYDLLRRAADTNKALYNALIQKFKEIDITGNIGETDIRVVEKAERPARPIRPNPQRTISLAALIGLALGVLAALLMEIMDPRIKSIEEFKEIFDIPILGTVPLIGGEQDDEANSSDTPAAQVSRMRPASIPAEAYRTLRTNVKFSHPVETGRSLLVTSSSPREGKTTTSINLAVTTALAGKRVLLIDADLRRPTMHTLFALPQDIGLTDVLLSEVDWFNAVRATRLENLSVLTAGLCPSNPAELLSSSRLPDMLSAARNSYDVIIIDTPPALSYATVNALMAADGLVMPLPPSALDFLSSMQFWGLVSDLTQGLQKHGAKKQFDFIDVVLSKVDPDDTAAPVVREWITAAYGEKVVPVEIPKTMTASSSSAEFGTVYDQPRKRATQAYDRLVELVEEQVGAAWMRQLASQRKE